MNFLLSKIFSTFFKLKNNNPYCDSSNDSQYKNTQISNKLSDNLKHISKTFDKCDDVIFRTFSIPAAGTTVAIVFIDGLSNSDLINSSIITPLEGLHSNDIDPTNTINPIVSASILKETIISTGSIDESSDWKELIGKLASGNILLFTENCFTALIIYIDIKFGRQSDQPVSEQTVRGSRESFVENIKNNITFIRKRIKSPNLAVEVLSIGKQTNQSLALVYMKGVINPDIPTNIRKEIKAINIDGIIGSGQIEELIQKHKWTFLPQIMATERPDRIVGSLLDGRAALITDGTPFVLIIPTTFGLFFKSSDDFSGRTFIFSLFRLIRYFSFIMSVSFSATYIALTSFHPGLLPTQLLLSITGSRLGVPFPIVIEILLMEITLYLIQEAAVRVPKPLGPTVGIVGGLVIGQSVVAAGLVSPIIVIIVSLTAISSFTLPNYTFSLSTIIMRLIVIFFASILGFYGLVIAWILLLIHSASLETLGVKYLEDFSPFKWNKFKNIINAPQHTIKERPDYLDPKNLIRQQTSKGNDKNYE